MPAAKVNFNLLFEYEREIVSALVFLCMDFTLDDFNYQLPQERIAKYPLTVRDESKLLHYHQGHISHYQFYDLPAILPENSTLVFNDTKVIPARLFFKKPSGAIIEIFLLEPVLPHKEITQAMEVKENCSWKCMIGNLKKWKTGILSLDYNNTHIEAELVDRENAVVSLKWDNDMTFSELISIMGQIPLPPYLNRETEKEDQERYQTIYSRYNGAIAAPTAGLHFTDRVMTRLQDSNIRQTYITLHVGAGTFQPVKSDVIREHIMHREEIHISKKALEELRQASNIIPVGTTGMRTLESIYLYAVKLQSKKEEAFYVEQHQEASALSRLEAFDVLINFMEKRKLSGLSGQTQLMITPGYQFKMCDGLVTNFHLPKSTLIMLIAAFVGQDWSTIYQSALDSDYRFLSYGDSSLLIPK